MISGKKKKCFREKKVFFSHHLLPHPGANPDASANTDDDLSDVESGPADEVELGKMRPFDVETYEHNSSDELNVTIKSLQLVCFRNKLEPLHHGGGAIKQVSSSTR